MAQLFMCYKVINVFVHSSIYMFICLSNITCPWHFIFLLTQCGSYSNHSVPLGDECELTLNHTSWCKVRVVADIC